MKVCTTSIFFSLTCIMVLLSCKDDKVRYANSKSPSLSLKDDSGYITKKDGMPFLLASELTDTFEDFWNQSFPHENDTIGKYYVSNIPGNKLVLVKLIRKDSSKAFALMEIGGDGLLLKHTFYPVFGNYCLEDDIRTFQKTGRFFLLKDCGHGSGYSSEYAYIFDHAVPEDSLSGIYIGGYSAHGKIDFHLAQSVSSVIEPNDTSVLLHYTIETANGAKQNMKWKVARKVAVRYVMKNGRWMTSDSSLLDDMDMQ